MAAISIKGEYVVRFVHTADWQLGMRRHFLAPDAQGRFSQDRLDAIAKIGALASELGAAFVVVAGDVFDDNQVDRQTVLRAMEVLRGFGDLPVLLLPGNHDPLNAGSIFNSEDFLAKLPGNVHVVSDSEPIAVAEGVEVIGAPWPVKRPTRNPLLDVLEALGPPEKVRILLAHGGVDEVGGDFDQVGVLRLKNLEAAIDDGLAHFVALGDRHSVTDVGSTGRIWYSGAPEPTDYTEINAGNVLLVEVDAQSVEVEAHEVGHWSFREKVFEVAGQQDLDEVLRWLSEPTDKPRTIGKLALQGSLTLRDRATLDEALSGAADTYGALEQWDRHADLITAPDDEDLDTMQVGGFVGDAVAELRNLAEKGDEDAGAASDALALLYRKVVRA
jgi:DNA repair exonuclease SbcCD nuclease subunit